MIGLILGTSEGKKILREINKFTRDIFVSTATEYGGELLKDYKYRILNTDPLDRDGFIETIRKEGIRVFLDATHPYAVEVSKNVMDACSECHIPYIRYERAAVSDEYAESDLVSYVDDYEGIEAILHKMEGVVFNTTGSRNLKKVMSMDVNNRIIHRVLPTMKVMGEIVENGIQPHDVIMIKGPVSYSLNKAFYNEYDVKCVIMKDSGLAGGTREKIQSALDCGIKVVVINRKSIYYPCRFSDIMECVEALKARWENEGKFL